MEDKELIENLKIKLKNAKKIINISSKDFRFKSWQTSTINLLRGLPSRYKFDVNNFKKLTFEDTRYHRGNKFFNPGYDVKYIEDINEAIKILKKITSSEIEAPKAIIVKKGEKTKKSVTAKKSGQIARSKNNRKINSPQKPFKT